MAELHADYIVVGAGSSGATVATRLARRATNRVLLLEAGQRRQKDFWVRVPVGVAKILMNPNYVWRSNTIPQSTLHDQEIYLPMGKLPGGSSSVNGMIFVRGDPLEYDHWRDLGCAGWGYRDVLPYFRRLESYDGGDQTLRGRDGPISVTSLANDRNPLADAFIAACQQAGIPPTDDYNGEKYEGISYLQLSTRRGERCSTSRGYLDGRPRLQNLDLQTESHVQRILFEGKRAVGVEYRQGDQLRRAFARKEVILSAGPIRSPKLLELSGVGDASRLQPLGIRVAHHLPGVGENFLDHLQSRITFECARSITLNDIMGSPIRTLMMGVQYMATKRGFMATPGATAHATVRTRYEQRPGVKIQIHHVSGADRYVRAKGYGLDPFPGFSVGFFQLRPESRGYVHVHSVNPDEDPHIHPNYLAAETDRNFMIEALRIARNVMSQSAIRPFVVKETRPGPEITDDAGLLEYIKQSGQTSWHPIGTCKMGVDPMSVVDPDLKVHGIEALRVVDSSIMPTMPSSNTNAASIMIGEKAADLIAGAA
ncbi:MAG TPA: GMC family oxidoreductase N-terminal domain-containing protein [Rhodoblastus sp.]|nr:GMC family oxidoreductase N-terminal domain-containing protein [Rhodoblastus sp.]